MKASDTKAGASIAAEHMGKPSMPVAYRDVLIHGLIDTDQLSIQPRERGMRDVCCHLRRWRVPEESFFRDPCAMRMRVHYRRVDRTIDALRQRHMRTSRLLARVEPQHIVALGFVADAAAESAAAPVFEPDRPKLLVDDVLGLVEIDAKTDVYKCLLSAGSGVKLEAYVTAGDYPGLTLSLPRAREAMLNVLKSFHPGSPQATAPGVRRIIDVIIWPHGVHQWMDRAGTIR